MKGQAEATSRKGPRDIGAPGKGLRAGCRHIGRGWDCLHLCTARSHPLRGANARFANEDGLYSPVYSSSRPCSRFGKEVQRVRRKSVWGPRNYEGNNILAESAEGAA